MKRICLALLLLMLLLLSACGGVAYEASGSHDFLKAIDGATPLSAIVLPGTHDSGALYDHALAKNTAKCQSLTVKEQLYIGVKYFDVRLVRKEGTLCVYHGPVDQKLSFDGFLAECYAYLDAYPTEALIVSVKEEGDMIGENAAFDEMVAEKIAECADKWYLGGDIPTLDTVRGKIVLWSRFSTEGTLGFDATGFSDNSADFTLTRGDCALRVEDYYDVSDADAKWEAIESFLSATKTPSDKTYYLTNTSGYRANFLGLPNIRKVSDPINERLLVYLKENAGFRGVIATDHITKDIAEAIIALNFTNA